jgi:hypothetical protein
MYDFNLRNFTLTHPLIHYFYYLEQPLFLRNGCGGVFSKDMIFIPLGKNV